MRKMELLVIPDKKLERRFRKLVAKKYGMYKGAIKTALVEAIKLWIAKNK